MKALWIDLETTGLNPYACAIHHVACIAVIHGVEERREWHIQPHADALFQEGWDVSGVTKDQVMAYETTPAQFFAEFIGWLGKMVQCFDKTDKMFWLGYNSRFDEDFMRAMFKRHKNNFFGSYFWTPSLDIMQIAAFQLCSVRSSLPNFKLGTVYNYLFNEDLTDAHDGMADIVATRRIFKKLFPQLMS